MPKLANQICRRLPGRRSSRRHWPHVTAALSSSSLTVKTSSSSDKTATEAASRLISVAAAAGVYSAQSLLLPGLCLCYFYIFFLNQYGLLQLFSLSTSSCLCSRKRRRLDAEPIKIFAGQVSKMDERGFRAEI